MNSDNRIRSCPARMSDGRLFTTYLTSDRHNYLAMRKFGLTDGSHQYRHFMINNAVRIKQIEDEYMRRNFLCNPNQGHHYSLFAEE